MFSFINHVFFGLTYSTLKTSFTRSQPVSFEGGLCTNDLYVFVSFDTLSSGSECNGSMPSSKNLLRFL